MATWDVSRAHLQGEARNWIYTFYPEGYEQKGKLAGLRRNVNLERHMVCNVFKDCSMTIGTSCPAFFAVKMEIPKDFAIEMTSAGWHDGSSCKSSGISWKNCLRCNKRGTSVFSAEDSNDLKMLNRTIMIDVQNDEMTLEADTKLVEDALETMKLVGAKKVDSPRVRRNEQQTAQIRNSEKTHASRDDFVTQLSDEIDVCRSKQG